MIGVFAIWIGVACMAGIAIANARLHKEMKETKRLIEDRLAAYQGAIRAFDEKYRGDTNEHD